MKVQNQILINLSKEPLEEKSSWKRILGPRTKFMDEKYQDLIQYKLIPILRDYDIDVNKNPSVNKPGKQTYTGYDVNGDRILFAFSNNNKNMDPYDKKKWTMFLRIYYKNDFIDVGMIDLANQDDLNRSFSLITQTLEDMGFKLKGQDEEQGTETSQEVDPDVQTLIDYKNSLSESELESLKDLLEE